jgi:hypothetical protein
MIKQYKQKQQLSQGSQNEAPAIPEAVQPPQEKIIASNCTLRKFIHGGNIESGYVALAGIIADEAGRGYSFIQAISFNGGECVIVFKK